LDMGDAASPLALPTATGFAVSQAVARLRKHNIAATPLLRAAGLSEDDFPPAAGHGNPLNHRVTAEAQGRFLNYAAEAIRLDAADSITLVGIAKASLVAADFKFV
jgi:hypothetical protein